MMKRKYNIYNFLIISFIGYLSIFHSPSASCQNNIYYGTGSWTAEGLGNHRAIVRVSEKSDAVLAHIKWRRHDTKPEAKDVIIVDALTGERVKNAVIIVNNKEYGAIIFQPTTVPGDYYVYYLPYTTSGWMYSPSNNYLLPKKTYETKWAERNNINKYLNGKESMENLPGAEVIGFEAIDEFSRFDPMEIVPDSKEKENFLKNYAAKNFVVFTEDRKYPARMKDEIPLKWIGNGKTDSFFGDADAGEYYTFQACIYALKGNVENIGYKVTDLVSSDGGIIPAKEITCFNTEGTNWLGKKIIKKVSVENGKIKPLWFGIDIPKNIKPGKYTGSLTITSSGGDSKINITINVSDEILDDHGDSQLWRYSRLRWLNSKTALDDSVFYPYIPVKIEKNRIKVLGRALSFSPTGLPANITSFIPETVDRIDAPAKEILSSPVDFVIETANGKIKWSGGKPVVTDRYSGAVSWHSVSKSDGFVMICDAKMECDGYVNYRLTIKALKDTPVKDMRLEIPIRKDSATYMMGMGFKGGYRPQSYEWKWDVTRANNMIWIGEVNAGIQCKLKNVTDDWSIYGLQAGLYRDWSNEGMGGCNVSENTDGVLLSAYSGKREIKSGQELHFNFGLLITPVKILDKEHWTQRYYQNSNQQTDPYSWISDAEQGGAKVVIVHQGNNLNPYINYPFLTTGKMADYVKAANDKGIKVKIYYTVRELSNYTKEIWALRSLDDEIFTKGKGFKLADHFVEGEKFTPSENYAGHSWLCEHLISDYAPAWHQPLGENAYDAAIATSGLSRWHNYYIEGLGWLVKNVGISGIYLDGIGYDREIMKRVRKVMDRTRSDCLIDFHSGNNYDVRYGLNSPANQYMEHFPFINSLWLGEGYDYNETPDYWMVEIAGIPYGLFSEMLHGGGNPWRGMVYGMTNRLGWWGDSPAPIWKLWDSFGIKDADMIGYWCKSCPVKTDNKDVLATVYRKKDKTLISIASWAKTPVNVSLTVDWEKLGLNGAKATLYAPEIEKFQPERKFTPESAISVEPGKGWLLIVEN